jgi:hypothetical protein
LSETENSYRFSRWLFIRLLALIYFIAFVSIWHQIIGLLGADGIIPVQDFFRFIRGNFGTERYWLLPTIFWFDCSNATLHVVCAVGTAFSIILFFGWASTPALIVLWFLYLSVTLIGQDFLSFQWDILLLETGFLAIFLNAPRLRSRDGRDSPFSKVVLWMLWWLLFRLMFSSGVVKLSSGDPAWRNLTALTYHYETQPLPTWIGWYAYQLPGWFQRFSNLLVFIIELVLPFFIFLPRKWRMIGSLGMISFQILIFLTGNYCFFNLLTIALCLLLIEDRFWPLRFRKESEVHGKPWPRWIILPLCVFLGMLSVMPLVGAFRVRVPWPRPLLTTYRFIQPFYLVNSYGLFAVMTKRRQEIILEGSMDGVQWKAYEFKYKPGDPRRRPEFVEPYQPRLDWQMWFAALETYQSNRWFIPFCYRIMDGSPSVLALLKYNPFPEKPPRFLRTRLYDYHFTDWATKRKQGTWWRREYVRDYSPVFSR